MADDINKNIIINISAETGKLEENITGISKSIDDLLDQQKKLVDSGKQTSDTYQSNSQKLDDYQKSLQNAITQLNNYITAVNSAISTLQKDQSLVNTLTATRDKYAKTLGDNSKKVKDLNDAIKTLTATSQQQTTQSAQSQAALDAQNKTLQNNAQQAGSFQNSLDTVSDSLKQQKQDVDQNKASFDLHGQVMDHLKTSFDEIKNVSGEFGPSLADAANGFNLMKSGLAVVKDGLYGIGDAMKADGFDFLLQILQQLFNAFINSSQGTKILQGAISAIGVVVNKVKDFFGGLMNGIISAVTHPIDSLKSLGNMIEQNIINRFKAFSVILDGIIHLDFKKMADGAIQAFTGVTDATSKISDAATTIKNGVVETANQMVTSFQDGVKQADEDVADHEKTVNASVDRQIAKYNQLGKSIRKAYRRKKSVLRGPKIELSRVKGETNIGDSSSGFANTEIPADNNIATKPDQAAIDKFNKAKEAAQQLKDFEIQTAQQTATAAFGILQNSIKQQAEAKVAALESQKNAELSNTNLTSSQKAIIEAKYKKQEDKVKAKAFKQEQEASLAQAVINGALAITKATSQTGILSPFVIPGIIAETAIQVATIIAQKPPAYAAGGLHYTSDGKGGLLPGYSRTDNTNAYLRSGEGIVVSEAMRNPWARNLVSAINVGFGGRDFSTTTTGNGFAVGGIFTDGGDANRYYNAPVNDQKNLANSIAYQMINNFPPVYVDVKDINNQQNILAQTINRVNL